VESIRLSQRGDVKIGKRSIINGNYRADFVRQDPTILPAGSTQTSADLKSLGKVMSQLMRENKETLELPGRGGWSAEAIDFLEATSSVSPDELSDVSTDSLPANRC
jgi:hypothetical protein